MRRVERLLVACAIGGHMYGAALLLQYLVNGGRRTRRPIPNQGRDPLLTCANCTPTCESIYEMGYYCAHLGQKNLADFTVDADGKVDLPGDGDALDR